MAQIKIKIRGQTIPFDDRLSKADIARILFADEAANYTTNEVSKAVPMAYSQAMTIKKKMGSQPAPKRHVDAHGPTTKAEQDRWAKAGREAQKANTPQGREQIAKGSSSWGAAAKAPGRKSTKPMSSPLLDAMRKGDLKAIEKLGMRKVGKLRTPGLPSDTACGECANCGHDVVVRTEPTSGDMFLHHTGVSAEEYLSRVQFCHAVPRILLG